MTAKYTLFIARALTLFLCFPVTQPLIKAGEQILLAVLLRPAKACTICVEGQRDTAKKTLDVPEGLHTVARLQTLPIWVVKALPQVTSVL